MKTPRLIDWLKLAPMALAAALLVGCDNAANDAPAPATDAPFGADTTSDFGTDTIEYGSDVETDVAPPADLDAADPVPVEPAPIDPVEETEEPVTP